MGTNKVFLRQAAGNKEPEDTILNRFFAKLSVVYRHNTGSAFEVGTFLLTHRSELDGVNKRQTK